MKLFITEQQIGVIPFSRFRYAHSLTWVLPLALLILFLPQAIKASSIGRNPDNLHFQKFDQAHNLTNSTIISHVQDHYGFIWFATQDGINRYDGNSIRHFKHDPTNPNSLINNTVHTIYEDQYKKMWIGTLHGISRYNQETESFKNYILEEAEINSNTSNCINEFAENSLGDLYTASEDGFIYRYDRSIDTFERINSPSFGKIKALEITPDDSLWIGSEKALFKYSIDKQEVEQFVLDIPGVDKSRFNYILDICYDEYDRIWIATIQCGLYYLNLEEGKIYPSVLVDNTKETIIHNLLIDDDENLWISSSFGLYILNLASNHSWHYQNFTENPTTTKAENLNHVFIDRQGNVWADTNVAYASKAFHQFKHFPGLLDSLLDKDVTALLVDSKNRLWVGYFGEGIDILKIDSNQKYSFQPKRDDDTTVGNGTVFSLFEDSRGNIWVGTHAGGLQRYDENCQNFRTYKNDPHNSDSIGGNDIRRIDEDSEGNLWVVTHNQGISVMNVEAETFKHYRQDPFYPKNSLLDNWPLTLLVDRKDTVWVGTPKGISKLNRDKATFTNFQHNKSHSDSLSNSVITVIFEDSEGALWFGTQDGLNKFDQDTNTFEVFRESDGIANSHIVGIQEDNQGDLWISTFNGLSRYSKKQNNFRNYDTSDGLHSNEFKANSFTKSEDGTLFFGGVSGITRFHPNEIQDNKYIPPIVITDFRLLNQSVPIGPVNNKDSILKKAVFLTEEITIPYHRNVITFNFTALNYIQSGKNQYAYVMEGFDEDWVFAENRKEATYTNLNPGKYIFRVKGSNNDNYWNENGTSIKLIITPPLWRNLWFKVFLALFLLGLITAGIFLRMRALRIGQKVLQQKVVERTHQMQKAYDNLAKANDLLEEQKAQIREQNEALRVRRETLESAVRERTNELEIAVAKAEESDRLKSSFLANMSHEIRTPMNAIIGFLQIMNRQNLSDEKWQHCMDIIQRSSDTLLRLIDDILDLSRIEAREIEISPSSCNLHELLEDIYEYFLEVAIKKEKPTIELKLMLNESLIDDQEYFDCEGFSPLILMDPVRLKQILSNIISNAIKFTDEGKVTFGYRFEHNNENGSADIVFSVKDTGIGIPPNQLNLIYERFYKIESDVNRLYPGAGLGLTITRKLVELMEGNIQINSEMGKGTHVEVILPLTFAESDLLEKLQTSDLDDYFTYPDWNNQTLLIAEDELPNYEYIEAILSPTEANIIHAPDGLQAIRLFRNNKIDLALIDIKMPGMNGVDVISKIREFNKSTPIIVQSAHTEVSNKTASTEAGAQGYIVKPYTPDQIIEKINEFL